MHKSAEDGQTCIKAQDLAARPQLVCIQQLQPEVLDPQVSGLGAQAQAPLQEQPCRCWVVVILKLKPGRVAPQPWLLGMQLQRPCQDLHFHRLLSQWYHCNSQRTSALRVQLSCCMRECIVHAAHKSLMLMTACHSALAWVEQDMLCI